ncbi:uncharacterized protein LOC134855147 [Symsagittifera roscoffensis]|uniref:uncharacterized protein LOC134855147 n=1 Tax=Symsagittifera roscoffensis TaxID=84072 RepID=UPI00307CB462
MGREKAALSVVILLIQLCVISFTVVSVTSPNWGYQSSESPLNREDIREVEIGLFRFCDSLRDRDIRRDDATKCVRCFNTALAKTYDTYFTLGISQSFLPRSTQTSSNSLARKGALLQTLAIVLLVAETAFFFLFLFYSQFALLLKIYRRLQNYLLLASLVSNICELACLAALLTLFRDNYKNIQMGLGQSLAFATVALAILRVFLIFKIVHVIVRDYNRSLRRGGNENYRIQMKRTTVTKSTNKSATSKS